MSEVSQEQTTNNQEPFSFVEQEHITLNFWKERNIFNKSLEATKDKPPYIFYDGPPFATGLPHHGHLVANTLKDIVPRYFTMKGRYVERRFGWDCHGLPIEHEIDKKLGMSAQDAVEKFGVKKYNDECRSIVQRYTKEWEKTVTRIGRWVDFENDYKTMDVEFMESVWWVFKKIWDKGLIYQGTKVVPFSFALGTVLSNFEATSNYQNVQDPAVTVKFPVKGEDYSLLAWTTTPWTLPSNLGLCVGEDINYVLILDKKLNEKLILAEDRLTSYQKGRELEVLKTLKGSSLVGKSYDPLFNFFEEQRSDGAFQIHSDGYVTTEDGTGIVHLAPAFGEDDHRVFRERNINAFICPVDDAGRFNEDVTLFSGQNVKEADKNIIKELKSLNKLWDQSTLYHNYPFCPRSDTPLIYKAIPSWYVNVDKIKDKLIESNKQINWVPEHIKEGRFGKWLENARDWAISRNRIWGTPLPIWINDESGKTLCFGSREELEKETNIKLNDIHREFVDELTFQVKGESGTYKRVPEVLDCWFESGSMPYAQLHYPFKNKELFESGFPAEFIAEGLDQTRGWFYTLTVLATALYEKPAFKNVIVNGLVMANDGRKMSKRLKNYTSPDILMEKFGADALRLFLINSGLVRGEELRFSDDGVKDMARRALLPWYNAFKFFQTYAKADGWNPKDHFKQSNHILDRWVISRLQTLIKNVNKEMDRYHLFNVVPELFNFIEDLTNWFIRLNRRRFWTETLDDDKCMAFSTLFTTVREISLLMAPFAPFLSEHIFQELKVFGLEEKESVHLCSFPESNENLILTDLEDAVDRMMQIILMGRQKRNQVSIKVKTPLKSLTIIHQDKKLLDEISKLEETIKIELNIKEIHYSSAEGDYIKLFAKPNSPILGKKLGKEFKKYKNLIEQLDSETLMNVEAGKEIKIEGKPFTANEILVFREAKEGIDALSNRFISVSIDTKLDDQLIGEGLAREVVNRIQKTRKDMNLNVSDRIRLNYNGSEKIISAIKEHQDYIMKETLSLDLNFLDRLSDEKDNSFLFKVEQENLIIEISTT
jgi:isoleucyl-tRNA synthetase